jgi:predicted DNA-binding ribbon-helix-helix protein
MAVRTNLRINKSQILKRSVVIGTHKTSVSLEEDFWEAVKTISAARDMTVAQLIEEIDHNRNHSNLSSAIRIFVLKEQKKVA